MSWSSCSAILNSALGRFFRQTVAVRRYTGTNGTHITLCSLRNMHKYGDWGHPARYFHVASVSCAGHNKWSKIKRKKAVTDLEKSKLRGKLIDKIRSAVSSGGQDPTTNLKLSGLLTQAKSMGLPKSVIESALKAAAASSAEMRDPVLYEGRGPNGYLILIEALTNNRKRTRPEIRHLLEKQGGVLGEPGSSSFMFEHKGIIQLSLTEGDLANTDPLDLAIEVGAEDCSVESDDDGNMVQLQCEPSYLNAVCNAVKARGLTVSSASIEYLPKSYVALTEQQIDKAEKLVDMLSDHSDVVGVYTNYELDSE